MSEKFWDADEVEGKYMEVLITNEGGEEHIYWVNLAPMPDDEDEHDWSIAAAIAHHNSLGIDAVSEDNAVAMEPFSRNESEFSFIG
jgi:hypothetical protein